MIILNSFDLADSTDYRCVAERRFMSRYNSRHEVRIRADTYKRLQLEILSEPEVFICHRTLLEFRVPGHLNLSNV